MIVFWTPLTLVQARGFVRYRVSYRPLNSQKRQEVSVVVSGDQGSVTIGGLLPGVAYDVVVVPFNTEPSGQELAGSPSSAVAPSKIAWWYGVRSIVILLFSLYLHGHSFQC